MHYFFTFGKGQLFFMDASSNFFFLWEKVYFLFWVQ